MSEKHSWRLVAALLGIVALVVTACGGGQEGATGSGSDANGASGCSMFKGETVTLVVPYSPGGGYDTYARMVAPYLAKQLDAEVVVENQEGAGGLLGINKLVASEADGTRLAIMNGIGAGGAAIAGAQGVQFDLDGLSYIGRPAGQVPVFVVGTNSKYETFEDVQDAHGFRFGATGPGAADYVIPSLLIRMFGLDARIVTGFEGSEESQLAVAQGDVDGQTGDVDSRRPAIKSGDERPVLSITAKPLKDLPDTPALLEQDLTGQKRAVAEALVDLSQFGRPIVGPPDIPADRLGCLRGALSRAMKADGLVRKSKSANRPLDWLPGGRLDTLVDRLLRSPPAFKKAMKAGYSA